MENFFVSWTPMTFRISTRHKFFFILVSIATLALGLSLLLQALSGKSGVPMIFALILFSIGALLLLRVLRLSLTIDDSSLRLRQTFSSRTVLLDEIIGYSTDEEEKTFHLILKEGGRALFIPDNLQQREELIRWVKRTYPDIDKKRSEEEQQRMLSDEQFGPTREIRENKLRQTKRVAFIATIVSFILLFWSIVYPEYYGIQLALVAPWVALYLTASSGGLMKLYSAKSSPYPSVITLFLLPAFGAGIGVLHRYQLYHFPRYAVNLLVQCTVLLTAFSALVLAKTILREKRKRGIIISFFVVAFIYSWGLLYYTNCRYDVSTPQVWRVRVAGKSFASGDGTWAKNYYLHLSSPKLFTGTKGLFVSRSLYQSVNQNDSVTVYMRSGKWDISWYQVAKE